MSGGGSQEVTVGYKYYFDAHVVVCAGPIDSIDKIEFADREAWTGTNTGSTISVDKKELFGGKSREGGVSGDIEVLMGGPSQPRNSFLESVIGSSIPAFRGVCSLVFKNFYWGNNPYTKPPTIWGTRIHTTGREGATQWYDAKAEVGGDMNPIHMLRELLTDQSYGMRYPSADIGSSFAAAADTLHTEGLGLSVFWNNDMEIGEFIDKIKAHINAELYVDRKTGKFEVKLIRDDYTPANLDVLNEDQIRRVYDFNRPQPSELINSVAVEYFDYAEGKKKTTAPISDIAMVNISGRENRSNVTYEMVTTAANAEKLAARDLRTLSAPIASFKADCDRTAIDGLNLGDPIKVTWPKYDLSELICRVAAIDLGSPGDEEVTITFVEDVFAQAESLIAAPPASNWTDPVNDPSAALYRLIQSCPYREIVQRLGDAEAQSLAAGKDYILACGVAPTTDALSADFYTSTGTDYDQYGVLYFAPTAVLSSGLDYLTSSMTLSSGQALDDVEVGQIAQINGEIIKITSISGSTMGIERGLLDTVPAQHSASDRVYFWDVYSHSDFVEYSTSTGVNVKMRTRTGKGLLTEASTPTDAYTVLQRQARPYPPRNIKLNGSYYPASVSGPTVSLTCSEADRLLESSGLFSFTDSGTGAESGTTYRIRVDDQTTNRVDVTQASPNYDYTLLGSETELRWRIYAIRDGLTSWQEYDYTVSVV